MHKPRDPSTPQYTIYLLQLTPTCYRCKQRFLQPHTGVCINATPSLSPPTFLGKQILRGCHPRIPSPHVPLYRF